MRSMRDKLRMMALAALSLCLIAAPFNTIAETSWEDIPKAYDQPKAVHTPVPEIELAVETKAPQQENETPSPTEAVPAEVQAAVVQDSLPQPEADPIATDLPRDPSAEAKVSPSPKTTDAGIWMHERSDARDDLQLDADALRIPSGGMPIPLIFQYNYTYGVCDAVGEVKTVKTSGCGATAASMVLAYACDAYEQTPYTLFYDAAHSGKYYGYGLTYQTVQGMLEKYGVESYMRAVNKDNITRALKENCPIIIKMGPGAFADNGHYIVLRGLDENGRVLVNDPNSATRSEYAFSARLIARESKDGQMLVVYPKDKNARAKRPAGEDGGKGDEYSVRVSCDQASLRKEPVEGRVLATVGKETVLHVTGEVPGTDGFTWCEVEYNGSLLYMRSDMITIDV